MKNKEIINVIIGTPAYNGQVYIDYMSSVINLINYSTAYFKHFGNQYIRFMLVHIGNESLIQRARNKLFTYFIDSGADFLLFIDGDIAIPDYTFIKLYSHQKDIIAVPVPLKGYKKSELLFNVGNILAKHSEDLFEVDYVGTGVMLISKKVADFVKENYKDKMYNFTNTMNRSLSEENFDSIKIYNVFYPRLKEDNLLSEDYAFCEDMRNNGFKIYIDPSIPSRHCGNYFFEGVFNVKGFIKDDNK